MKNNRQKISMFVSAAICLVSIGLGWFLGGVSFSNKPNSGEVTEWRSRNKMDQYRMRISSARQLVNGIGSLRTQDERMRATIELANGIDPSDFADWIEGGWFNYRNGFELTLFRSIIEERWRQEDPEGFVAWCLTEGDGGPDWATGSPRSAAMPVLKDWALNDPDRLTAFFNQHTDDGLESSLIAQMAKKQPDIAIGLLQKMLARGTKNNYHSQSAINAIAQSSPQKLQAILESLPFSVHQQAERALALQGLKNSFEETVGDLWQRPDGWRIFSSSLHQVKGAGDKLFPLLANMPDKWKARLASSQGMSLFYNSDPGNWLKTDLEAAGFTTKQAGQIKNNALRTLSLRKPEKAIQWLSKTGLSDEQRVSLVRRIFNRMSSKPEMAAEWMTRLETEAEKDAAQKILDSHKMTSRQERKPSPPLNPKNPGEWIEGILTSDTTRNRSNSYQFSNSLNQWKPQQIAQLVERFDTLSVEKRNSIAAVMSGSEGRALMNYPVDLSSKAIHHILSQPGGGEGQKGISKLMTRKASELAVKWGEKNPVNASRWIDSLPDGEAKKWARKNLAATWRQLDPQAAQKWIETLPKGNTTEAGGE